jgi:site-specific recombinase XerD
MEILKLFYRWASLNVSDIRCIKFSDILNFKNNLIENKKAPNYINFNLFVLRNYFKWLYNKGYYENITINIKNVRVKRLQRTLPLNSEQIKKMVSSIDRSTKKGERDYLILKIMFETGCRTVEVQRMNVDDIFSQGDQFCVFIQPKGSTDKTEWKNITMSYPLLLNYIGNRTNGPLFISLNKNQNRVSKLLIQNMIRSCFKYAGIVGKMYKPHSIRYTYATEALPNISNSYELQALMSHHSIRSVAPYISYGQQKVLIDNKPGKMIVEKYFTNI